MSTSKKQKRLRDLREELYKKVDALPSLFVIKDRAGNILRTESEIVELNPGERLYFVKVRVVENLLKIDDTDLKSYEIRKKENLEK